MRGTRRFSQAISEGDGISVLADVDGPDAARAAERDGADGLVVRDGLGAVRGASELPILARGRDSVGDAQADGADAFLLVAAQHDEEDGELEAAHGDAAELGLDCVVEVADEDHLRAVLDRVDPEILLLPGRAHGERSALESVLGLLADVPVGKLVVAEVEAIEREDLAELERAGTDAVIVSARDVARLLGAERATV